MKTVLFLLVALTSMTFANPAADKQRERQEYREQQRREAEERAYRQLLIEYLDRIARQRR